MSGEKAIKRKEFLSFFGRASLTLLFYSLGMQFFCKPKKRDTKSLQSIKKRLGFVPLEASDKDELLLAEGFKSDILIRWGDPLNSRENFGFNNDYLACLPLGASKKEALLWANHESVDPFWVSGFSGDEEDKKKSQVIKEQLAVGGSIVHIKKSGNSPEKKWEYTRKHPLNRRLSGKTKIPFAGPVTIEGSHFAIGTLANCAGGLTPWNTVLTCEENYGKFYGDYKLKYKGGQRKRIKTESSEYFWDKFYTYPPEHYGWVVEIDPFTGRAKKHISMGRFCHEGATVAPSKDGRVVVYMGDDASGECLYKFVSNKKKSLLEGELFVANLEKGEWVSLDYKKQKKLQNKFQNQIEVLTYTRQAAHLLGGSPLDRPEDIAIDPKRGSVIVALTNNIKKWNFHGSLLKIDEEGGDPLALSFQSSTFLAGGQENAFSCPDNLLFDSKGNLWFTNDMAVSKLQMLPYTPYTPFKNNGLFYVPMSGPLAGEVFQIASAPIGAELTGPAFLPDKSLLLSVQHPGEGSTDINKPKSRWPDHGKNPPKPSVAVIHGEALERLLS